MTLGEKIKQARLAANLSQEQFAEKLSVSRQAVTKWETDRGLPDISNLQAIAKLFDVSVDYLLDDGEALSGATMKEAIDPKSFPKTKGCRSQSDAVARGKFPEAVIIYPLLRRKKLTWIENILDFITQPGIFGLADNLNNNDSYYVVDLKHKQLLVRVSKEYLESTELTRPFTERKRIIGNNIFTKMPYTL